MVELKVINDKSTYLEKIRVLYENSFPITERRDFELVVDLIRNNDKFNVFVAYDTSFLGFVTCWNFEDFVYVEHFAVCPELRGSGYGTDVLNSLKSKVLVPIILEVEPPIEEICQRRINFYKRNGFILYEDFDYQQPPYRDGGEWLDLKIMSTPRANNQLLSQFKRLVYKEVYNQSCDKLV